MVASHRLPGDGRIPGRRRDSTGAILMMALVGLAILVVLLAVCIGFIRIEDRI